MGAGINGENMGNGWGITQLTRLTNLLTNGERCRRGRKPAPHFINSNKRNKSNIRRNIRKVSKEYTMRKVSNRKVASAKPDVYFRYGKTAKTGMEPLWNWYSTDTELMRS